MAYSVHVEYELLKNALSTLPQTLNDVTNMNNINIREMIGQFNTTTTSIQQQSSSTSSTSSNSKPNNNVVKDWGQYPEDIIRELPAPKYHVVISTGCTTFQDWQAYANFFHAYKSGQEGYITRVVGGCTKSQIKLMNEYHTKFIQPIAPGRFFLHHTPSYRYIKPTVDYVYFNKAYGYLHWMVNALRYPYTADKFDNTTFILLDPGM